MLWDTHKGTRLANHYRKNLFIEKDLDCVNKWETGFEAATGNRFVRFDWKCKNLKSFKLNNRLHDPPWATQLAIYIYIKK